VFWIAARLGWTALCASTTSLPRLSTPPPTAFYWNCSDCISPWRLFASSSCGPLLIYLAIWIFNDSHGWLPPYSYYPTYHLWALLHENATREDCRLAHYTTHHRYHQCCASGLRCCCILRAPHHNTFTTRPCASTGDRCSRIPAQRTAAWRCCCPPMTDARTQHMRVAPPRIPLIPALCCRTYAALFTFACEQRMWLWTASTCVAFAGATCRHCWMRAYLAQQSLLLELPLIANETTHSAPLLRRRHTIAGGGFAVRWHLSFTILALKDSPRC